MKKRKIETIKIEYDGKKHIGERLILGSKKLDQVVSYQGICLEDLKGYKTEDETGLMYNIAQQLLWEIVRGNTLSKTPSSKYGI